MKKLILILLFVSTLLNAQFLELMQSSSDPFYTLDLDGSTEYAYKTSPTGLDLNSANYLSGDNTTFTTTVGNWVNNGAISSSIVSNKMQVVATGTTTSDYISLPQSAFSTPFVHGKNHTVQLGASSLASSSIKIGCGNSHSADLVTNGDFSNGSTGWTGNATITNSASFSNAQYIRQTVATGSNITKNYITTFDVVSAPASFHIYVYDDNNANGKGDITTTGTKTVIWTTTATTGYLTFLLTAVSGTAVIDNIKHYAIGSAITTTGTEATKAYTFTYDSTGYATTGNPIKIFPQANDTYTFDNADVSERRDAYYDGYVKLTDVTGLQRIVSNRTSNLGFEIYTANASEVLTLFVGGGAGSVTPTITYNLTDNAWCHYVISISGNTITANMDGVSKSLSSSSIASVGAIRSTNLSFGAISTPANYLDGELGLQTITIGSNTSIYDWSGDADTFLDDKGTLGNDLAGTNITLPDVVKYKNGYK